MLHPSSPTLTAFLGSSMHVICEGTFIFPCDKGFLIFRSDDLGWSLSLCSRFKLVKEAFIDVPLSRVFLLPKTERFLIFHGYVSIKTMKSSSFFILT